MLIFAENTRSKGAEVAGMSKIRVKIAILTLTLTKIKTKFKAIPPRPRPVTRKAKCSGPSQGAKAKTLRP